MLQLNLIKSYIKDQYDSYDYLVDGSCKVEWLNWKIITDKIEVTYRYDDYYTGELDIDLLDLMAYIFDKVAS